MSIFAIGDLHLSFQENKPMSVFGENWRNHENKIEKDWIEKVKSNDTVLLVGDFSWAMDLENTQEDFKYINKLKGEKILLKGNHDYWWNTVTKMKKYLKENNFEKIDFLYNNSFEIERNIIAGTKGWTISEEEEDKRLIKREALRLELSIQDGIKKYGENKPIIVCMHYPPITINQIHRKQSTIFMGIMKKYKVKQCIYGHLHSNSIQEAVIGEVEGINLKLVSADAMDFKLYQVQ